MNEEIAELKRRVTTLEQYREKDKSELHQLDKSLQVFINEMKNISDDLKTVVSNFKEAVVRSTNATQKDLNILKEQYKSLEKKFSVFSLNFSIRYSLSLKSSSEMHTSSVNKNFSFMIISSSEFP